jgi:DNA-binding NarL/FixJ family response regulator
MNAKGKEARGKGASSVKTDEKASILVVDDHPIVRQGLADLVDSQKDFFCCASAGDLVNAQEAVVAHKPDVVLLDLRLGQADGLESIKTLKSRFENLRIVIISQFDETVYAERSLRAGAMGYVMKDQATEEVLGAIRAVLAGQVYLSRAMTNRVLKTNFTGKSNPRAASANPRAASVEKLTDRELHVLQLLGVGISTRKIAGQMNLSIKTVETYREHLKQKLGLSNSTELVHYATHWVEQRSQLMNAPSGPMAA